MPTNAFWHHVPELTALAEIAYREKFCFVLRGSAAQTLVDAYAADQEEGRLLEAMPPLSDLDLVVDNHTQAYVLAAALAQALPASRFFRVDIRTKAELEHYHDAPLMITGQPHIRFGGVPGAAPHEVVLKLLSRDSLVVDVGSDVRKQPSVIPRPDREIAPHGYLENLIWISRRFPHDDGTSELLSKTMAELTPRRIAEDLKGRSLRKLLFDLVKLLLQLVAAKQTIPSWLDAEFLGRVAEETENARFKRVVQLLREPPEAVMTVVVPRREGNRWLSHIEAVEPLRKDAGVMSLLEDAGPETSFRVYRQLPPARVTTDDPERPGCCRYRDFSRGVMEVAWTWPEAPEPGRLTLVTIGSEFFLAPSIATRRHGQHSVKVDYGFLCQLSGVRRPIDIHFAGVDDVD